MKTQKSDQPASQTIPSVNGGLPRLVKPDTLQRTLAAMQKLHPKCGDEGVSIPPPAGDDSDSASDVSILGKDEIAYDLRHPLYNGDWVPSIPNVHDDISQDSMDEPHLKRRMAILDKHPEIKELYGIEWRSKWVTIGLVILQFSMAQAFGTGILSHFHWGWMLLGAYVVGATATGIFGVLIHEFCHNLGFKSHLANRMFLLVTNMGLVFPIAQSFRRYHLEHHAFQGVHGRDPDLPLVAEWKLVRGNKFLKLIWVFCFPFMYIFRGAAMMKKPQRWEIINWVWTIACDLVFWHYTGPRGFLYMVISMWFGYGIHPGAAHFIQEHYTFRAGQETYSYYGPANPLFLNIGFHNEHHDFTQVPWSALPKIRAVAGEFYNTMAFHTSWIMVLVDFVMKDEIGPQSRIGRTYDDHKAARATLTLARKQKAA